MSEVKSHLKTLARGEEDEVEDGLGGEGVVKMFMVEYKSYSEEFTSTLKTLLVGEFMWLYFSEWYRPFDFTGFFQISGFFTNLPLPLNVLERREVATKERKK